MNNSIYSKSFIRFNYIVFITILLVIIAGGIVRMTQSGMGCPDWPKCFGKWIPPTHESDLPINYKQIYEFKYVDTSFNVYHTWIEYINRLLGALLGVLVFVNLIWAFQYFKKSKKIVLLSFILFVLTGFQGWLGKLVVDTNLSGVKITIHLIGALLIAALSMYLIMQLKNIAKIEVEKSLFYLAYCLLFLLLVQLTLGTFVRTQIDAISLQYNFTNRELWISKLNYVFYIHRSFSLMFSTLAIYIYIKVKDRLVFKNLFKLLFASLSFEIVIGILLNYFSMPAVSQPLHLLFSTIICLCVAYFCLILRKIKK